MLAQPAGPSAPKLGFSNSRPARTIGAQPRPTCHAVSETGGSGIAETPRTVPRANRTAAPNARAMPGSLPVPSPNHRAADSSGGGARETRPDGSSASRLLKKPYRALSSYDSLVL